MSTPAPKSPTNRQRLMAAAAIWDQTISQVLRTGYYGTLELRLTIADGTVQSSEVTTTRTQRPDHDQQQQPPAG